jgi:hypothetical protein
MKGFKEGTVSDSTLLDKIETLEKEHDIMKDEYESEIE